MNIPCPGGHEHVRIEGKYTKLSAVYHPELAKFIAEKFKSSRRCKVTSVRATYVRSQLKASSWNDILQPGDWEVEAEWTWQKPAHINVLESRSLVALFKK